MIDQYKSACPIQAKFLISVASFVRIIYFASFPIKWKIGSNFFIISTRLLYLLVLDQVENPRAHRERQVTVVNKLIRVGTPLVWQASGWARRRASVSPESAQITSSICRGAANALSARPEKKRPRMLLSLSLWVFVMSINNSRERPSQCLPFGAGKKSREAAFVCNHSGALSHRQSARAAWERKRERENRSRN